MSVFFFAIGTVISTYLDNSKTALIIAFTVWVFAVLITPRVGFLAAKLIAPTRTSQSVYMEKSSMRGDFNAALKEEQNKMIMEIPPNEKGHIHISGEMSKKITERMKPFEAEYRSKFQNYANKLDRDYKRETERQEQLGQMLSRITPTSSLIYITTNLTQTGKGKRSTYFQTGDRYYEMLYTDLFSKIIDYTDSRQSRPVKITQPPSLETITLGETLRQSMVDVLLLCFFAVVLTTVAFLKFFRSDI
ncbi:hypothetical protein C6501_15070 [Candidatus Poribacteria bacterium]|nr:MAG: hypothetical protein C6501_15070 [Candidatus Poribacteria bacterium]